MTLNRRISNSVPNPYSSVIILCSLYSTLNQMINWTEVLMQHRNNNCIILKLTWLVHIEIGGCPCSHVSKILLLHLPSSYSFQRPLTHSSRTAVWKEIDDTNPDILHLCPSFVKDESPGWLADCLDCRVRFRGSDGKPDNLLGPTAILWECCTQGNNWNV